MKASTPVAREVLGRCPAQIRWTPSKPMPWWFGSWSPDRRFTVEQEAALIKLGRDPVTAEVLEVRREISLHDSAEPVVARIHEWLPVYQFECPVIGPGAGGMVRVIGPNGKPKGVRADGWAHRPSSHPYQGAFY